MLRGAVNLIPGGCDHRDCFLPGLDAREAGQQQHPAPISGCFTACSFVRNHEGLLAPSLCPFRVGVRCVTSAFNVFNPSGARQAPSHPPGPGLEPVAPAAGRPPEGAGPPGTAAMAPTGLRRPEAAGGGLGQGESAASPVSPRGDSPQAVYIPQSPFLARWGGLKLSGFVYKSARNWEAIASPVYTSLLPYQLSSCEGWQADGFKVAANADSWPNPQRIFIRYHKNIFPSKTMSV